MRQWLAVALLVANAVISVLLVLSDALIYFTWGPVQAVVYAAAVLIAGRAAWGRPCWALLWVVLAGVLMFPFGVMMRVYGFVDLLAFYYHFQEGITANSLADAYRPMIVVAGALTFFLLSTYHITRLLPFGRWPILAGVLALLAINPVIGAAYSDFRVSLNPEHLAERISPPQILDAPDRPDIVWIYMEGTELGYGNTDVFGDIFAPIKSLFPEALTFTNVDQVEGTGWTMAGIVSSQCGLPLLPNKFIARNLFFQQHDFMVAHTCLGDVLARRGYQVENYASAEGSFAGTDNFLASHSYARGVDIKDIQKEFSPEEFAAAYSVWVVDDQMLFDTVRHHYEAMIGLKMPLAMVMQTFGPHGPDHVLSRECSDTGKAERLMDMKPVVACEAHQVVDFIRWVQSKQAERGRETVFVIQSDHLSHDRHLRHWLVNADRRNTVMMIGPRLAGTTNDRHGAMIDVYPTFLDYMGLLGVEGKAGLGVSLLRSEPTLVEEFGIEALNDQLRYDEAIRDEVWKAKAQ